MNLPIVCLTAGSLLSAATIYTGTLPPLPEPEVVTVTETVTVVETVEAPVTTPTGCFEDEAAVWHETGHDRCVALDDMFELDGYILWYLEDERTP